MLVLYAFFPIFSNAQTAQLMGQVINVNQNDLGDKTLASLRPASAFDSTFGTPVSQSGHFNFKHLHAGQYTLFLNIPGYKSIVRDITIPIKDQTVDLGEIILERYVIDLDTVTIRKLKPEFQNIGDTLAYNSNDNSLPKNANVEELIQQIPGLTVDADARIFLHGREISKVLVDGESFFNGDTKIAIRNLPAEIVEQVQVYHESSQQSLLTGIKDIDSQQTLNIKIKPGRKVGTFGQLIAAAGVPKITGAAANYNVFRNQRQVSIVAQTTNANDLTSGLISAGSLAPGINRIGNIGFNFKDNLTARSKLQGSYVSNFTKSDYQQAAESEILFSKDSSLSQVTTTSTTLKRTMHRANANYTLNLTNKTHLTIRPSITITDGHSNSYQDRTAFRKSSYSTLVYSNNYEGKNHFKNTEYSARAELSHAFPKQSRALLFNADFSRHGQQNDSDDKAITSTPPPSAKIEYFVQQRLSRLSSQRLVADVTYIEPIAKGQILSLSYVYRNSMATDRLQLRNPQNEQHQQDSFELDRLNQIRTSLANSEIVTRYQLSSEKLSMSLSSGINFQHYNVTGNDRQFNRSDYYVNLTPTLNLEYSFSQNDKLQTSYSFTTQPPQSGLLQNLARTSDSLMIFQGNPNLRQTENHSASLSYRKTYTASPSVLTVDLTGSMIRNDIQYAVTLLSNGSQITSPINVEGTRTIVANVNYSRSVGKNSLQNNLSGTLSESQSVINSETVPTWNFSARNRLSVIATIGNSFRSQVSMVNSLTSIKFAFDSLRHNHFFTHEITGNVKYSLWKSTVLAGNLSMLYNSRLINSTERQIIPVFSISISQSILKSKAIDLRFVVNDFFNRGLIAYNSINQNSFERVSGNIRTRYLQFSISYNYRNFPNANR